MNRIRTPVQPFNYGKDKETKQMGISSEGKEAALEPFFVGLQRAVAFPIKPCLHILEELRC